MRIIYDWVTDLFKRHKNRDRLADLLDLYEESIEIRFELLADYNSVDDEAAREHILRKIQATNLILNSLEEEAAKCGAFLR